MAQPTLEGHTLFAAPWRHRLPGGELGEPYGPTSPAAQATQTAREANWSYQPPPRDPRRSKASTQDVEVLVAWVAEHRATLPPSELRVFVLIFERGRSIRWVARELGMRRQTIKSYVSRLRAKAGCA